MAAAVAAAAAAVAAAAAAVATGVPAGPVGPAGRDVRVGLVGQGGLTGPVGAGPDPTRVCSGRWRGSGPATAPFGLHRGCRQAVSSIAEYELEMDPADLRWFRSHVGTDRIFPGSLRVGSESRSVWIGYRGNYSRWFRKPSYDLWLGDGPLLQGHHSLHLNAAYRDPSLLRGRLAMQVFADLGVPTPGVWHIWLRLNGGDLGVYAALESLDAAWYQRQGLPSGPIYYAVGSQGNFGLLDPQTGRRKKLLAAGYEKCHPHDEEFDDLERLIYQITLPAADDFASGINSALDVDGYLRWLVGLEFVSHTDGLVQNYALFRPQGGRWQVSPWDCDGTFGRMPDGYLLPPDDMPVGTGEDNYLIVRLLATPRWRRRYCETWEEALETTLTPGRVNERLQAIYQQIRPWVLADERKRRSNSTFLREPTAIRRYVAQRTVYVRQRLGELKA